MVKDPNTGRVKPQEISVDYCPMCVIARETGVRPPTPSMSDTVAPRLAIEPTKAE